MVCGRRLPTSFNGTLGGGGGCITTNRKGKGMYYLTTHSTHFIYDYMASDIIVKDHLDSERGNPLPPHGLLFPISSKGSLI